MENNKKITVTSSDIVKSVNKDMISGDQNSGDSVSVKSAEIFIEDDPRKAKEDEDKFIPVQPPDPRTEDTSPKVLAEAKGGEAEKLISGCGSPQVLAEAQGGEAEKFLWGRGTPKSPDLRTEDSSPIVSAEAQGEEAQKLMWGCGSPQAEDDPFWSLCASGLGYVPPWSINKEGDEENLAYGLASKQGRHSRVDNTHAIHTNPDESTSFFGIYVGHGGNAVAEFCSKHLHQEVIRNAAYSTGHLESAIRGAFLRMDELMRRQSGCRELVNIDEDTEFYTGEEGLMWIGEGSSTNDKVNGASEEDFVGPTCGSEACTVIIRNRQLVVANLGNSRCVLSSNGQAYTLSEQHTPDIESEQDRIMKAGGCVYDGRISGSVKVSRAIGYMQYKDSQIIIADPSIEVVELCEEDDYIVLACGIWDCMSSQQLVDLIHDQLQLGNKISTICERLLNWCLASSKAEGCDDMTIIIVQFKKPIKLASPLNEASSSKQSEDK